MFNIVRLTKSAHCTFLIYVLFWVCYLPYVIIVIIEMCLSKTIMETLFMCSEIIIIDQQVSTRQ